jgi:DNA primase
VSASKNHYGAVHLPGGHGTFYNVSGARRCPACGGDSWCSVRRDGANVACRRDTTGEPRTDRAGVDYWLHQLSLADHARYRDPGPAPVRGIARANAEVLDPAYHALLARLGLSQGHRADLHRRGLSEAEIDRRGYRTLRLEGRARFARHLVDALGEDVAASIPGLYVAERDGRRGWSLAGSPGLVVPVRDVEGHVVALKVRRDEAGDGPKYTYLSSAKHGGPSALQAVHVPLFEGDRAVVRVTEGELKSDVCIALSSKLTISVPGVGSYRLVLPVLERLGATRVLVAFDADHRTNPAVARALADLVRALRAARYTVAVETWDPAFKGLDDWLASQRAGVAA